MAGPACLVSSQSVALYELFQQGEWDEAIAAQRELWVMNQMFSK
jgi:4-hydroxy-tetrahydrodipicolinate synthase